MRTLLTAASLPLAICIVGCSSAASTSPENENAATTTQDLYGLGSIATAWPNGVVPVCFQNLQDHPALRAEIPSILALSWSSAANITFTGFGSCAPSGNQVTVVFSTQADFRGSTSFLGASPTTVTLVSDDTSSSQAHFTYEVIHEFGHALGFAHEMQRPDNWNGTVAVQCGDSPSDSDYGNYAPVQGGIYLTATYDSNSVMNYCNPAGYPTSLSGGDTCGASSGVAYGPALVSTCSSEYVPAGYGSPVGYHTIETLTYSSVNCGGSLNTANVQELINGKWVSLDAFTESAGYPTTTPGVFDIGAQSNGVTTSGAPIASVQTVRTCTFAAGGADLCCNSSSCSACTCAAPQSVQIKNCDPPTCQPWTCDGNSCGILSNGCGDEINCTCSGGTCGSNGICSYPPTSCPVRHCPKGLAWDPVNCECGSTF
jgi:hypothetical protein